MIESWPGELLDRRFVIAGCRVKHRRRVAQLAAWHELAVVPSSRALNEPAQGLWTVVALETRQHRSPDRQHEELGPEKVAGEVDRLLCVRVCCGQISPAYREVRPKR